VVFASLYPGTDVWEALLAAVLLPFLFGLGLGACLAAVAHIKGDNKVMAHALNPDVLLGGVLALSILWGLNAVRAHEWERRMDDCLSHYETFDERRPAHNEAFRACQETLEESDQVEAERREFGLRGQSP